MPAMGTAASKGRGRQRGGRQKRSQFRAGFDCCKSVGACDGEAEGDVGSVSGVRARPQRTEGRSLAHITVCDQRKFLKSDKEPGQSPASEHMSSQPSEQHMAKVQLNGQHMSSKREARCTHTR